MHKVIEQELILTLGGLCIVLYSCHLQMSIPGMTDRDILGVGYMIGCRERWRVRIWRAEQFGECLIDLVVLWKRIGWLKLLPPFGIIEHEACIVEEIVYSRRMLCSGRRC